MTIITHLRHTLERWNAEYKLVLDEAHASNLHRTRVFSPLIASLNGFFALVFLWLVLASPEGDPVYHWKWGQFLNQAGMGLMLLACAAGSRALEHRHRSWAGRWLPVATAVLGIGFSVSMAVVDQWVSANITPFFLTCTVASLALYLRPGVAALMFTGAWLLFCLLLGETQSSPEILLSHRINGLAVCVINWFLSILLWRKFTLMTLQQQQLERTNAELQSKQRELERLTRQDGLTGLFNRNTFVELSVNELNRAKRQGSATTILLMDLDHFKRINDTWGHPAGDAVLRHVAQTMVNSVRSTDLVGRLGGEEFIVLLPHTAPEAGRKIAEKIRQRLELSDMRWEGTRIAVTSSIGLAGTTANENRSFDSLYTEADKALYLAKQRGRNRVM
nr:GGDEF domain-containing protein [uncultured Rhodoferax sp.]